MKVKTKNKKPYKLLLVGVKFRHNYRSQTLKVLGEYYEQLCVKVFNNLTEKDKFLERYNL